MFLESDCGPPFEEESNLSRISHPILRIAFNPSKNPRDT